MNKKTNHKNLTPKANLHEDLMPQDAFSQRILQERAALLAQVEVEDDTAKQYGREYIKFRLGEDELYGIAYANVADIRSIEGLTKVPNAPRYVLGVHYWHGKIIPVIDLASYFGITATRQPEGKTYLTTITRGKFILGFLFDDVVGSDMYLENKIDANIVTDHRIKSDYVVGIHSGQVVILNIHRIVDDIVHELMRDEVSNHE